MSENNEFSFENPQYRKTYWHTCSHVMAQAVKRLWPEVKLAIGPSIDNGFYYDFDAPFNFTQENLDAIEAEMRKICKEKLKLERFELPREEAIKYMQEKDEPYKVELINDLPEDAVIADHRTPETALTEKERTACVQLALLSLDATDREVFLRFYYYCQRLSDISREMGLNESTVKSKLRRGREKLRSFLLRETPYDEASEKGGTAWNIPSTI